jgi:chitinase
VARLALLAGQLVACGDSAVVAIVPAPPDTTQTGPGFPAGRHLAAYWGQDLFGGANPNAVSRWEESLVDACTGTPYDFVIVSFVTGVASGSDGSPSSFQADFANHCIGGAAVAGASGLSVCDDIAAGIAACHKAGKRVLLSIGEGDPGLQADTSGTVGEQAAQSTWDLYLGGKGTGRPFPGQSIDGIDLAFVVPQNEAPSVGFVRFAARLRELMNQSGAKYYLTGRPECAYPDPSLGPGMGTVLGDALGAFDALFVEYFYDPRCSYSATDASGFQGSYQSWAALTRNGRPAIFVGLSLEPQAVGAIDRSLLPKLLGDVKTSASFGGLMLRDVSYDQNSADSSGITFGAYAKTLLP